MIRSIDLLDLPNLHRYRAGGVTLDSALALTWGTALISARAVMDCLLAAGGTLTCLATPEEDGRDPLLAQARYLPAERTGRLTFLAPAHLADSALASKALDYLAAQVGGRGGVHLLADVAEDSPLVEALRRSQFTVVARQHIWQFVAATPPSEGAFWRPCQPEDLPAMRRLYKALVPPLVRTVEPPPREVGGLVCWQEGKLRAFVQLIYGPRGIWLQPFVHPDLRQIDQVLRDLIARLPSRMGRVVHINVRSYQSWLNEALAALGAESRSGQVVMVRRLAVRVAARQRLALNILKNGQAEMPTSITHFRLPHEN